METKDINGMRVLDQQAVDEIIAWCENDEYLTGGQVNDIEKRLSNDDGGYKDVSYKRWHFETETNGDSYYIYKYIDIQEIMAGWYVATVEIGVKRRKGMWQNTVAKIYEYVSSVDAVRSILALEDKLLDLALLVPRPS